MYCRLFARDLQRIKLLYWLSSTAGVNNFIFSSVRCTWFYCSGFLGSYVWSVQVREWTLLFPTARQTHRARPFPLLPPPLPPPSLPLCPLSFPRTSAPCRPALPSSTTLCHIHHRTGPTPRLLFSPIQATEMLAPTHTPSLMVICLTWASRLSRPRLNWSQFRRAEPPVMGGLALDLVERKERELLQHQQQ